MNSGIFLKMHGKKIYFKIKESNKNRPTEILKISVRVKKAMKGVRDTERDKGRKVGNFIEHLYIHIIDEFIYKVSTHVKN